MTKKKLKELQEKSRVQIQIDAMEDVMEALERLNHATAYAHAVGVKTKTTDLSNTEYVGMHSSTAVMTLVPTFYVFNSKESK